MMSSHLDLYTYLNQFLDNWLFIYMYFYLNDIMTP